MEMVQQVLSWIAQSKSQKEALISYENILIGKVPSVPSFEIEQKNKQKNNLTLKHIVVLHKIPSDFW